MKEHYEKIVKIIRHSENEEKHLYAIGRIILHFQKQWYKQITREDEWEYLKLCAKISDEYSKLRERLNIKT
jgi:hypothetical protein